MNHPHLVRGRSKSLGAQVITIAYKIKWEIIDTSCVGSYLKIQLPASISNKIRPLRIQITQENDEEVATVQFNIEDNTIESLLRQNFVHQVFFPFEPITKNTRSRTTNTRRVAKKPSETFLPEYFQVDAKALLLPNPKDVVATCAPTGYKSFTLIIHVDRPILNVVNLCKFSPVFLHIKSINNMPNSPYTQEELEKKCAPVFFKCIIRESEYITCPQKHAESISIDTYIVLFPRIQSEVIFEIHDRDRSLPSLTNSIGTGLIYPYQPPKKEAGYLDIDSFRFTESKSPYGFSNFYLLPARKTQVFFQPSREITGFGQGNFCESQTHLKIEVFDPSFEMKSPTVEKPLFEITKLPSPKIRPKTPISKKEIDEHISENNTTLFYRWIFTCKTDEKGINDSEQLIDAIYKYHSQIFSEPNKKILETYTYKTALKKSFDIITGFVFETEDKKLIILETRATSPNIATEVICKVLLNLEEPKHIIVNEDIKYPFPRIYNTFDTLIKKIECPITINSLINFKEIYFHKSPNSVLFTIVQKLNYILNCKKINSFDVINEFFPTTNELLQLLSRALALSNKRNVMKMSNLNYKLPLQNVVMEKQSNSARVNNINKMNSVDKNNKKINKNKKLLNNNNKKVKFEPFGNKKVVKKNFHHDKIGDIDNGEVEIWLVNDPKPLFEKGFEVETMELCSDRRFLSPRKEKKNMK